MRLASRLGLPTVIGVHYYAAVPRDRRSTCLLCGRTTQELQATRQRRVTAGLATWVPLLTAEHAASVRADAETMRPYTVSHLFRDCEGLDHNRREVWLQALAAARKADITTRDAVEEADRDLWYTLALGEAVPPSFVDIGTKRWYKWYTDKTASRAGKAPHPHRAYQELMTILAQHLVYAVERLQVRIMDVFSYSPPPEVQRPARRLEDGPPRAPRGPGGLGAGRRLGREETHPRGGPQQPPPEEGRRPRQDGEPKPGRVIGTNQGGPADQQRTAAQEAQTPQEASEAVGRGEPRPAVPRLPAGPMHRYLQVMPAGEIADAGLDTEPSVLLTQPQLPMGPKTRAARPREGLMLAYLKRYRLETGAQAVSNQRTEAGLAGLGTREQPVSLDDSDDDDQQGRDDTLSDARPEQKGGDTHSH